MTMSYTEWETQRFHALFAQQQAKPLSPDDLAELIRLERRNDARRFLDGLAAGMGSDLNIEQALEGVHNGLVRDIHARNVSDRIRGLTMGLQAALDEPDALMAAVRVLLRNLEADAEVRHAG